MKRNNPELDKKLRQATKEFMSRRRPIAFPSTVAELQLREVFGRFRKRSR